MTKSNDNSEEKDLDLEEGEEDTDTGAEAEDQETDDSSSDSEEEADEDSEEESSEAGEDEEGDDDKDEDEEDDGEEFVLPEKFKGKKPEEIAKAYTNLEKSVERLAMKRAKEILAKAGTQRPKGKAKTDDELAKDLEKMDFSKMDPKEFARWTLQQIDARAVKKAQEIYDQSNQVRGAVSKEIREATKAHPHLKENAEYREVVISLIEAAAARGDTMTLKAACQKADKAMGIKPGEKKDDKDGKGGEKKKPRTGVEKPTGTDSDPNKTEEDKIKESIMGGGKSTGALGGLGV